MLWGGKLRLKGGVLRAAHIPERIFEVMVFAMK